SSDSCRSIQSIGEKIESSIHSQAIDDSATGVVQGSRTRNRTIHLPLKSATRMFARTLPSSTMNTIDTPVKISVLFSAFQNTGSAKTCRQLRSPTQSKEGSPEVT